MKKILLSFMTIVVFALIGCNASAEDISEISSLAEEISEVKEDASEVSETISEESSNGPVVSEEQNGSETASASAEKDGYLEGMTVHTMWIQEMSAKEAVLNSIWSEDYSDDTKATVVGLLLQTEEGGDHISFAHTVKWYSMENGVYAEIEESTIHDTASICGDELAVVVGRFPADKVDVNNLYLGVTNYSGTATKYYQVEPDNLFDISSLEASESVTPQKGEIVYFHDIPFIVTACPWDCDLRLSDYDLSGYAKREEPCMDNSRTIILMPLTGQLSYDFSFYNTSKLSDNYDSENYAVVYATRWVEPELAGTIEGNCVAVCVRYMWYYKQAQLDAYKEQNPNDYYSSGFYDQIRADIAGSDMMDTYLELENTNRPATKLYILQ